MVVAVVTTTAACSEPGAERRSAGKKIEIADDNKKARVSCVFARDGARRATALPPKNAR